MYESNDNEQEVKKPKFDFERYAFVIAIALIFVFEVFSNVRDAWMFFMMAWLLLSEVKYVIDAKRGAKGTEGKLQKYTEDTIYFAVMMAILAIAMRTGHMYASWLAGPITFVLFAVIWPVLRNKKDKEQARFPVIPLIVLLAGIVAEVVMGGWIAFPVSWILICAIKICGLLRSHRLSAEVMVDIVYYVLSIALISIGLIWGTWIFSWIAFPIAATIGRVVHKVRLIRNQTS